jgi:serine/threonine protein kinase
MEAFKINNFTILKKIGKGVSSSVFLAVDEFNKPCIIKENSHSMVKELLLLDRLNNNTNLNCFVSTKDYFCVNNRYYLVMPYEKAKSIKNLIVNENKKQVSELKEIDFLFKNNKEKILTNIMIAVNELHRQKVYHLDIKPNNICLRKDLSIYLIDFETAVKKDELSKLKKTKYTQGYAPIEQLKDSFMPEKIGAWTDYYYLGATLFHILEKKRPPLSSDMHDVDCLSLMSEVNKRNHPKLCEIIAKLLNPAVEARQSLRLSHLLDELLQPSLPSVGEHKIF